MKIDIDSISLSMAAIIGAYLVAGMCWEQIFNHFGF